MMAYLTNSYASNITKNLVKTSTPPVIDGILDDEAWKKAGPILKEAINTGRSDKSFCPIVGMVSKIMIFDMKPAVPVLNRGWDSLGFPTLREFGLTR